MRIRRRWPRAWPRPRASTGIGLTLLPVFYAHGGFGGAPPNEGQRRFVNGLDGFARLLEAQPQARRVAAGCASSAWRRISLRAVTPEELAQVVALGGPGPIHIHAAEQTGEVEQCLAWSGARPVQWLLDHAPVDTPLVPGACHAHDGRREPRGSRAAARSPVCVPITEANLGDGIFPGDDVSRRRRRVRHRHGFERVDRRVPTSCASSNTASGCAIARATWSAARRARSTGRVLFEGAVRGGAQALGCAAAPASSSGAAADFFSLT